MPTIPLQTLQQTWRTLYTQTLPALASQNHPSQPHWPVTADHCFARIILDNTVGRAAGPNGEDTYTRWDNVLSRPATRNMNAKQLEMAIELGRRIESGSVDLGVLDGRSLGIRGGAREKRRRDGGDVGKEEQERASVVKKRRQNDNEGGKMQATLSFAKSPTKSEKIGQLPSPASEEDAGIGKHRDDENNTTRVNFPADPSPEFFRATLKRIEDSDITPFRKRLYTILLSVPRGQYTTYAAMAAFLGSAARAVGNGMRNNPFAPDVPCHRVLASDGTIGGFMGVWTKKGEKVDDKIVRKISMLKEEGLRFDSVGKVKGPLWRGFKDLDAFERELGKIV